MKQVILKRGGALFLLGAALFSGQPVFARDSIGTEYTGARHYTGLELDGAADLNADKTWEGDLDYQHVNSTIGGDPSTSNLTLLGATYSPTEANDGHGAVGYWNDTANHIHYAGPTGGYTHTWLGEGTKEEAGPELFMMTINTDLYFYSADVDVTVTGKPVKKGAPSPVSTKPGTIRTTQFHPNVYLEKPLFDEIFVPYLTAGHYFYSNDPSDLESVLNRASVHLTSASTSGLNSLVGGFLANNFSLGAEIHFMEKTMARLEAGRDQSATDHSWSTVYSVKLEHTFGEHIKTLLGWNHLVQQGVAVDFGVVGLTYLF